jgi:CDP-glycerol glycerophosphotransferase
MAEREVFVSIIIPVYNAEPFLRECLDSVLVQDYCDYEVIMVNDGSTDGSLGLLKEYAGKDSRFVCINQENQGAGGARNTGIEASKGMYLLFLDADDMLARNTLLDLIPVAQRENLDMINMNVNLIPYHPGFPSSIPECLLDKVLERNEFLVQYAGNASSERFTFMCTLFKAQVVKESNVRFKTKFAEDILFNMQALLCCERFYLTKREYYFYRQHESELTSVFFDSSELVFERKKASLEMLKITTALDSCDLLNANMKRLQNEIINHAGMRFEMFQEILFLEKKIAEQFPHDIKIAFWGAGRIAKRIINTVQNTRLINAVFVDNDSQKQGGTLHGYPVVSPRELLSQQHAEYIHIITTRHSTFSFFAQMKELGIVRNFKDMRLPIGENEQYDLQLEAMDDLYSEMTKMGVEINYKANQSEKSECL